MNPDTTLRMTPLERRATTVLAAVLLLRMLGLFMVLPVLSPWALSLAGHPGLAVGLAVGIYGLTQALLQIPLGWLSDRIGRRPVIVAGLLLFVLGSIVAARAGSIESLIVGRLLQGSGAIAAASTAWLADLLRESVRSTALAVVGMSIGFAFLLALLLGPALLTWLGVPGLFQLGAVLGAGAILLVLVLPNEAERTELMPSSAPPTGGITQLVAAVGVLHMVLAALFVVLPLELEARWGLPLASHWKIWLPTVTLSMVVVFPLLRVVEKRGLQWSALPWMFVLITVALALFVLDIGRASVAVAWLFFAAFNFLEASLPSLLTRLVGPQRRGRVMGIFSSCQFFGVFVGGGLAGVLYAQFGASGVYLSTAFIALLPALLFWQSASTGPTTLMSAAATKLR